MHGTIGEARVMDGDELSRAETDPTREPFRPRTRSRQNRARRPMKPAVPACAAPEPGGREALLASLLAWLETGAAVSVHALIGPGGIGKTHLARELCRRIDPPEGGGAWTASIISGFCATAMAAWATRGDADARPALLAVDNAAAAHEALAALLDRLAAAPPRQKLRILLLERDAPRGAGWWRELTRPSPGTDTGRAALFWTSRPDTVPDVVAIEERRALMRAAHRAASAPRRGGASAGLPASGADAAFDLRLAAPHFGNPLHLAMAGMAAAELAPAAALALSPRETAARLADKELRRLSREAGDSGLDRRVVRLALALNEFAAGLPLSTLHAALTAELRAWGKSADVAAVSRFMTSAFPVAADDGGARDGGVRGGGARDSGARDSGAPRLATVHPPPAGRALTILTLDNPPWRQVGAVPMLRRAIAAGGPAAAAAAARLAQDFAFDLPASAATETARAGARRVLGWLAEVAEQEEGMSALAALVHALPGKPEAARDTIAGFAETLARISAARMALATQPAQSARLAGMLECLAARLNDLGRPAAALTAAEGAVRARRDLADLGDEHMPDFAASLNDLTRMLADLGKREAAHAAAVEAVIVYRGLAAARPEATAPGLAVALNNLASARADLGRRDDALEAATEAVRLGRGLEAADRASAMPVLATCLNNLAAILSDLGLRDDARAIAAEAVGLYRVLAAAQPEEFAPDLAASLSNLAAMLSRTGLRQEALAAAAEAVQQRRHLAARLPGENTASLALALNNLATLLSDLDQPDQALQAAEEAASLYRDLAAARPDRFAPDLATSLNNLANRLTTLGQQEGALAAAAEAVRLRRALAASHPDEFVPNLATSLANLATMLAERGRHEDALAAATEAVSLRRTLVAARPDAFMPALAGALGNLAARLGDLGRREEALEAAEETVFLRRALAAREPEIHAPDLALALNNLATRLADAGLSGDALGVGEEALRLYRGIADQKPGAYDVEFARCCWVVGDLRGAWGDPLAGVAVLTSGMWRLTPVLDASPTRVLGLMRGMMASYLTLCAAAGIAPDGALLAPIDQILQRGHGAAPE